MRKGEEESPFPSPFFLPLPRAFVLVFHSLLRVNACDHEGEKLFSLLRSLFLFLSPSLSRACVRVKRRGGDFFSPILSLSRDGNHFCRAPPSFSFSGDRNFLSHISSCAGLVFSSPSLPRSLSLYLLSHFLFSPPLPHFLQFSLSSLSSLSLFFSFSRSHSLYPAINLSLSPESLSLSRHPFPFSSSLSRDGISLPSRVRISTPLCLFSLSLSLARRDFHSHRMMGISFSLYATGVPIIFHLPLCHLTSASSSQVSLPSPPFWLLSVHF